MVKRRRPVLDMYIYGLSCLGIWYPKKNIGMLWQQIHLWFRPSVRITSFFTVVPLEHHSTNENVTHVSFNALLKYIMILSPVGGAGLRILNSDWATGWNFRSSSSAIWKRFSLLLNVQVQRASYSIGARVVYRQRSSRSIKFNTYLHIILTLYLLTWRIWWAPNNASKGQMRFNLAFKGLRLRMSGAITLSPTRLHGVDRNNFNLSFLSCHLMAYPVPFITLLTPWYTSRFFIIRLRA